MQPRVCVESSLSKLSAIENDRRSGVLQSTGLQRVGHNWKTEQQQQRVCVCVCEQSFFPEIFSVSLVRLETRFLLFHKTLLQDTSI